MMKLPRTDADVKGCAGQPELRAPDKIDPRSPHGSAQAVLQSVLGYKVLKYAPLAERLLDCML